jgi:uncharacterized iron-regulated protein
VIIVGEVHDNPEHHDGQALAVKSLEPSALVFEMLTAEQAARVTPDVRGDPVLLAEALRWDQSGWPEFSMYHPIFLAAPQSEVYGAAVPREHVLRAAEAGAAATMGSDAAQFGLDIALAEGELSVRLAEQAAAHCDAIPDEMLPGMVEAQRLRDAALARATITALDETGGPVVVITGNGHARRDWGVPRYLATARPALKVLSFGQLESAPDDAPPFDFWRVTAAVERPDPCEAFQ